MRFSLVVCAGLIAFTANAQDMKKLGTDLQAKRDALPGFHQEFQITELDIRRNHPEDFQYIQTVDVAQNKWRQFMKSSSGDEVYIYDGQNGFYMKAGGQEYRQYKPASWQRVPGIYQELQIDWTRAKKLRELSYGGNHTCLLFQAPAARHAQIVRNGVEKVTGGTIQFALDSETGLLVQYHISEDYEDDLNHSDALEIDVKAIQVSVGRAPDPALFRLPSGIRRVDALTNWDADHIRKELAGKSAPDLKLTDMQGNTISLANLKGETVLLDFWATWCLSCQADGPLLDKLYAKYGEKNLAIVGISVDEPRDFVESYLDKHPHKFPLVLSSENAMPKEYELPVIPTYIMISPDGTVAGAVDGDHGFGELRFQLKKAGLDTD